jgi:hypothetical protein
MYTREVRPGEPFDIGFGAWTADYPDPSSMLGPLLTTGADLPSFADPAYQRRLGETAQLTGPKRYLTYGELDLDLARNAHRLRQLSEPGLLLTAHRLPELRRIRHRSRRALHQARATLNAGSARPHAPQSAS